MRTLLVVLASLALVAFLPAPAQAQVFHSQMTITLNAPTAPLTNASAPVLMSGVATYTGDPGSYLATTGIPIAYTITKQPAWASVIVSPATDIIPMAMPASVTYTYSRAFQVVVSLDPNFAGQAVDQIEITVTSGAPPMGTPSTAKTSVPIVADVSEEPCELGDHEALFDAAVKAADAYASERGVSDDAATDVGSSRPSTGDPELITQDTGSKPVALPWVAIAGFALVGAGVGLVLRRRFR